VTLALYYGFSVDGYLAYYPDLTADDVRACLEYCANERCLDDQPLNFCQGCVHDKRSEERPAFFIDAPGKFDEYARDAERIDGYAYLGTQAEYEEDSKPKRLWEFARECLKDLSACPIAKILE